MSYKISRVCQECGKEFLVHKYRLKHDTCEYCSRKCADIGRGKKRRGESHPLWKGGRATLQCLTCGKEFTVCRSRLGKAKYCSMKCRAANTPKGKDHFNWRGKKKKCAVCGKQMWLSPSMYNRIECCSLECKGKLYTELYSQENSPFWRGNPGGYNYEFKHTREQIRLRDGYICQLCGDVENGRALDAHHIDYNKTHDIETNLITLCRGCHGKTNYSRAYWQRFFTKMIQKKYAAI